MPFLKQKTYLVLLTLLLSFSFGYAGVSRQFNNDSMINPFAKYSKEWDNAKYDSCNTAGETDFFTEKEKETIWVLNMVRINPQLFLKTVLLNPKCDLYRIPDKRNDYYKSLIIQLQHLKPQTQLLMPDFGAYKSAFCHAKSSGEQGYVGHERRRGCVSDFYGECCDYGIYDPAMIILDLLIDENIPSLGHRKICLSPSYDKIGVSIQPHKIYGINTVLDFK